MIRKHMEARTILNQDNTKQEPHKNISSFDWRMCQNELEMFGL